MAQSSRSFVGVPTAEEWEARRSWITQLYLTEDKELKNVMAAVNVGGFKATTKMYKSRITKWGLDKKNKEHEARAILRLHAQRIGKPTQMRLRGRLVDVSKIETYFKRKGMSVEDVLSSDFSPPSDVDLVCKTPSPIASPVETGAITLTGPRVRGTPPNDIASSETQVVASRTLPQRIEAPDALKMVEYLFSDIREYVMGSVYALHRSPTDVLFQSRETREWSKQKLAHSAGQSTFCPCLHPFNLSPRDESKFKVRSSFADIGFTAQRSTKIAFQILLYAVPSMSSRRHGKSLIKSINCWLAEAGRMECVCTNVTLPAFRRIVSRLALLTKIDEAFELTWQATERVMVETILFVAEPQNTEEIKLVRAQMELVTHMDTEMAKVVQPFLSNSMSLIESP